MRSHVAPCCDRRTHRPAEQLRIGDRFTNNDGEWEVASRPVTFKHETTWPAFEQVKVRRTST